MLATREQARRSHSWELADKLRMDIGELGYVIRDSKEGQILYRAHDTIPDGTRQLEVVAVPEGLDMWELQEQEDERSFRVNL